jgi:hypothetical protein
MKEARVREAGELVEALKAGHPKIELLSEDSVRAFIRLKRNYYLVKTFTIVFSFFTIFAVYFALYEAMGYPLWQVASIVGGIIVSEIISLYLLERKFKPMLSYELRKLESGKFELRRKA